MVDSLYIQIQIQLPGGKQFINGEQFIMVGSFYIQIQIRLPGYKLVMPSQNVNSFS